jgi:hypothetical protein
MRFKYKKFIEKEQKSIIQNSSDFWIYGNSKNKYTPTVFNAIWW